MKEITKYKANDGTEFTEREECMKYEGDCFRISVSLNLLPEKPEGCDFSNGSGFIQHDKKHFLQVRKELLIIAGEYIDHKWIEESIYDETIDASWAGRLIGEIQNKALRNAWHRISCTSKDFREYGQPYFVTNPNQAKQIQLNG